MFQRLLVPTPLRSLEFSLLGKTRGMSPAQLYALVFGTIHIGLGIVGFFVASGLESHPLLLFPVNGPHNVVHLLIGAAGLSALRMGHHLQYARAMALFFAMLTLAGFLPQPLLGLIDVGGSDMFLHGLIGVAGDSSSRQYTRW